MKASFPINQFKFPLKKVINIINSRKILKEPLKNIKFINGLTNDFSYFHNYSNLHFDGW